MANMITKDDVKAFLQITDTSRDSVIDLLIPLVISQVANICPAAILDPDDASFDAGIKLPTLKLIAYELSNPVGVESEKIGDIQTSYPKNIMDYFKPFRKVKVL
jgi:hypothetical protein